MQVRVCCCSSCALPMLLRLPGKVSYDLRVELWRDHVTQASYCIRVRTHTRFYGMQAIPISLRLRGILYHSLATRDDNPETSIVQQQQLPCSTTLRGCCLRALRIARNSTSQHLQHYRINLPLGIAARAKIRPSILVWFAKSKG